MVCSPKCFSSRSVVLVNHFSQTFFGPFISETPIAIHSKRHKINVQTAEAKGWKDVAKGLNEMLSRFSGRTESVE